MQSLALVSSSLVVARIEKGSPLVFLVIAIACFPAGVVLFTYSPKQVRPSVFILALTIPMYV